MLTAIIDYSSGNLHSAQKAFKKITASNNLGSIVVTSDPEIISTADRLVLPGDGAFPSCKSELMSSEAYEAMVYSAVDKSRPFLGICVGMQLMAIRSYEYQETQGLGWIDGEVRKINPKDKTLKILDKILNGETPKPGSYRGRINNEPENNRKTLMDLKNA